MRRVTVGLIVVAIGVMMALHKAEIFDFSRFLNYEWNKYLIPAVIILIGLSLAVGHKRWTPNGEDGFKDVDVSNIREGEIINASVAFSGSRYNLNDQMFNGAKLDAFCGGITLDLTGAEIADKCVIEVHTLMGGVEIKAPSNVRFVVSSNCIFGGVDNKNQQDCSNCPRTIYLKADCLFGGVKIR